MNGSYDSMGYEGGSFVGGSHVGGSVVGGSAVGGGFGSLVSGLAAALPGAIKAGQDAAQTAKSVRDVVDAYRSRA
jgi:outer membrane lipoprotein SlyB